MTKPNSPSSTSKGSPASSAECREADVANSRDTCTSASTAHIDETIRGSTLEINLHGRLTKEDYEWITPNVEQIIRDEGRIRILLTLHDFAGWDPEALWEDLKWNSKHLKNIERMAVVGERTWHHWLTAACKPFTHTQVRHFEAHELERARRWISSP